MPELNKLLAAAIWYTTPAEVDAWAEAVYDRECWFRGTAPQMEITEPCKNTMNTSIGRRFPTAQTRRARDDEPTTTFVR